MIGLALVLATTVVYTQSAQAATPGCGTGPGGLGGGPCPGGCTSGQNPQANDNCQGNEPAPRPHGGGFGQYTAANANALVITAQLY